MIGEHTVSFSCWNDDQSRFVEVQYTIRLEDHADADVSIEWLYTSALPEALLDVVHQGIYAGVHTAIGYLPTPSVNGVTVKVLQLSISTQPEIASADDGQFLADILETEFMSVVGGLWNAGQYVDGTL
jgi:hypothetical protein